MKKKVILLIVLACILVLTACSKSTDDQFIEDVERVLEEKHEAVHLPEMKLENDTSTLKEYCKKESSFETDLYIYLDQDFEDVRLESIAIKYLEGIKEKDDVIKKYEWDENLIDNEDFMGEYYYGEIKRYEALKQLVQGKYGLNSNAFDIEKAKLDSSVETILSKLEIKKNSDSTYLIEIKNTTNKEWKDFRISIDLLDINGEVVSSGSGGMDSVKPRKTMNITFEPGDVEYYSAKCSDCTFNIEIDGMDYNISQDYESDEL